VLAGVGDGTLNCYLAVDGERILGLAVVLLLSGYPVAFLEYLAVDPAARNTGVGSRILDCLRRDLAGPTAVSGIIFEVDPPDVAKDDGERELRERRIGFYNRNGAVIVDEARRYRAPAPDEGITLPYLLMWLPVSSDGAPTGARLKAYVNAIFTQGYGLADGSALARELIGNIG
jgi:GNAT superfamily N-acetyltransferase